MLFRYQRHVPLEFDNVHGEMWKQNVNVNAELNQDFVFSIYIYNLQTNTNLSKAYFFSLEAQHLCYTVYISHSQCTKLEIWTKVGICICIYKLNLLSKWCP